MRTVLITRRFEKDLRSIPEHVQDKADRVIDKLAVNPTDSTVDVRKLTNTPGDWWRVRVGSYRLLYSFDTDSLVLHRFGHRKDIYR